MRWGGSPAVSTSSSWRSRGGGGTLKKVNFFQLFATPPMQCYGSFPAIVAILECLCSPPSLEKHRVSCYFNNEGCKVIKIFAFPFPVDIKLLYMKDLQTVHFLFINAFSVSTKNHTSKKDCRFLISSNILDWILKGKNTLTVSVLPSYLQKRLSLFAILYATFLIELKMSYLLTFNPICRRQLSFVRTFPVSEWVQMYLNTGNITWIEARKNFSRSVYETGQKT